MRQRNDSKWKITNLVVGNPLVFLLQVQQHFTFDSGAMYRRAVTWFLALGYLSLLPLYVDAKQVEMVAVPPPLTKRRNDHSNLHLKNREEFLWSECFFLVIAS